jgi:hypothetical protein
MTRRQRELLGPAESSVGKLGWAEEQQPDHDQQSYVLGDTRESHQHSP